MAKDTEKLKSLYEGFGDISKIDFGNTPQKVADPLLDDELVPMRKGDDDEDEDDDEPEPMQEPDPEEYETVPKVEYGKNPMEIDDDGDDDDDDEGYGHITEENIGAYEALAHQLIEGFINPAVIYFGGTQYDKWVHLSETLQHAKIRLETKMADGKMSDSEQKMYSTIISLNSALNQAKDLYKANLPLTKEEKELTEKAILDYLKIKQVKVTPEQIMITNIFSILSKRTMPIVNDRNRFYKAEV